ncbi:restriction endonuclease subunit S [Vibrio aestuarianus]|uniref:Restriction endonuclease subunit S n=1 Tax=Vibrio aestuarianus TaxID=28171 RepID=A0A9X4F949_9VIBR|nr:restriction endonuclease subunit S [Vibrio aestuarianus]MDE1347351.1 restriction endonuclease subunit S [Vibrio aestuarianus]
MVPNEYLPSHLCEIPNHWKRVRFLDVMKVRQGLQIAISERLKEPTATSKEYITIQSINKADQAREYVDTPSHRVICNKDDVLMTRTGNTGIVVTGVDGVFHNNFFLMDFDRGLIDSKFLVNYLRTNRVQHLILTKAGASTIPDLNHKDFYSIEFPLAPLPEQRKIAQILSTWDKAIATTEKLIDASKQQKKALMQQLLTGKKRLVDPETGKAFEGEWEEVKLGEILKIGSGKDYKHLEQGNVPVYGTGGYMLSVSDYLYDGDSVCIGRKGTIDKPMLLSGKFWTVDTLFFTHSFNQTTPQFIYQYFLTINWKKYNEASGVPSLSKSIIEKISIKIPILEEQQKIASLLTAADKEIELLNAKLAHFKQEKKALMQQLLTGKRRVQVEAD